MTTFAGPDAGSTAANRGPSGQVEFNRITSAGNYGWPYCTGSNTTAETYVDYVFPSGPSGNRFNCAAPVNNSPRNTGLTNLPAARPACSPCLLLGHSPLPKRLFAVKPGSRRRASDFSSRN